MNGEGTVLAQKLAKYPVEVPACIVGATFTAAGIAIFAIAGAAGVSAFAVWLLAAIITVAGLGFVARIVWDFVRYRRTPAELVAFSGDRFFVLGAEQNMAAITHVAASEARGRKGPLSWGTLVLRSGESRLVCRYVQDVREAQARVLNFLAVQRRQSESNG